MSQVSPKSACSATETSKTIEISLVASLDMKLTNKRITKGLIRLPGLNLCCMLTPKDRVSQSIYMYMCD